MSDLKQNIIKFDYPNNFEDEDFFISKSNSHLIRFLNNWPKWEKNFINISGERFSGKTHLISIFLKKFNGIKFDAISFNEKNLKEVKLFQNIILENMTENINEKLIFTLMNNIDQENKFLIITSHKPIVEIKFKLNDLISRSKNFILHSLEKPDDELIYALILKNLSDRQIVVEKKLINYITKRIERSYSKIFDFIYKIDQMSLKKKKSINLKIIKEALGE